MLSAYLASCRLLAGRKIFVLLMFQMQACFEAHASTRPRPIHSLLMPPIPVASRVAHCRAVLSCLVWYAPQPHVVGPGVPSPPVNLDKILEDFTREQLVEDVECPR